VNLFSQTCDIILNTKKLQKKNNNKRKRCHERFNYLFLAASPAYTGFLKVVVACL
jgi:hypothetical protein